jgi:putative FmdB family regulatory protein
MPLYDYDCAACGRRFEVVHGVHADPPTACPLCGKGPIRKAISAPAIHYKGSGWAKKERNASAPRSSSSSSSSAEGSSSEGSSSDRGSSEPPSTERSTDAAAKSEGSKSDGDPKPKKKTETATAKTTD